MEGLRDGKEGLMEPDLYLSMCLALRLRTGLILWLLGWIGDVHFLAVRFCGSFLRELKAIRQHELSGAAQGQVGKLLELQRQDSP